MQVARTSVIALLAAAVAYAGAGLTVSDSQDALTLGASAVAAPPRDSDSAIASAESLSSAFENVAEIIAPSVVTVRSIKEIETRPLIHRGPQGFFFQSPFDQFFGQMPQPEYDEPEGPSRRRVRQGEGSGVVVSEDGYILTNSHVVDDADEVEVVFSDDRQYTAAVVGADPKTDVAVLKIDSDGLRAATFGDSDALRVGQWVVAAGNPFGLSSSITTGIVSATGRSRMGIVDYEDFIQTDAAINRGNSGGPLVNLRGEVVGINTAILSRSGGNIGIGFAIPINMARDIMEDLIDDGQVVRGYLGVLIQDLSEGMASSFGYRGTNGALVNEVTEGGPAAEAGLEPGDIIMRFGDRKVRDVAQLRMDVAAVDPGVEVELEIFRNGKPRTLEVRIAELPGESVRATTKESSDLNVGMTIETLTPRLAHRFGIDDDVRGVLVTGVEPLGPAARAGLRSGDVITAVHDAPVANARAFRERLRDHDLDDGVRLTVRSRGVHRFVFLRLDN